MQFKNCKIGQKPKLGRKPKAKAGDALKRNQVLRKLKMFKNEIIR